MYCFVLILAACFEYFASAGFAQETSKYVYNNRGHGYVVKANNNLGLFNNTYYEKPENMMRVPVAQNNEEYQPKKHLTKKSPKRTIQKIIKKNRKNKKFFLRQVTSQPTQVSVNYVDVDDAFIPDEDPREDSVSTTQGTQRKKMKRWNAKLPRNPTPFQRLSNHKRTRREVDRDNTVILQDFDEVEFLGKKKGDDVVRMHAKKYW